MLPAQAGRRSRRASSSLGPARSAAGRRWSCGAAARASRSSTRGARATRARAPAAKRASSARPTARGPSTRRWPSARWQLWRAHDAKWQRGFFRKTGALWMFGERRRASAARRRRRCARENLPIEELTPQAAAKRFPQIAFDDTIKSVLWEPEAGYLFARRACEHVRRALRRGRRRVPPGRSPRARVDRPGARCGASRSTTARAIEADAFVFACGPWLGRLFPDVVGKRVTPTRQEVYYFGTPPGDTRFLDPAMPVWVDYRERLDLRDSRQRESRLQGRGRHAGAGVRSDRRSARRDARRHRGRARVPRRCAFRRSPRAPLLGSEVCQYEASPDSHFIIDRHPAASNVWIAGGGSGHGFKMGPAIGELLASHVLDRIGAGSAVRSGPAGGDAARAAGRRSGPERRPSTLIAAASPPAICGRADPRSRRRPRRPTRPS